MMSPRLPRTEDEALAAFGMPPAPDSLGAIRSALASATERERGAQGDGDSSCLRALCEQLFFIGDQSDTMRVWAAKRASWDASFSVDVQLLALTGLAETTRHLERLAEGADPDACEALAYLARCVDADDFEEFSVASYREDLLAYYA